jgi:hypothetical protein
MHAFTTVYLRRQNELIHGIAQLIAFCLLRTAIPTCMHVFAHSRINTHQWKDLQAIPVIFPLVVESRLSKPQDTEGSSAVAVAFVLVTATELHPYARMNVHCGLGSKNALVRAEAWTDLCMIFRGPERI